MPTTKSEALRSFRYLNNDVTVHADASDTNGQYAILEMRSVPGSEPPMHIHQNADEMFIVIEGKMNVIIAGVERVLSAGESATVKRGTPHTFKILTPSMRSFAVITPAGFEEFFRAFANDPAPGWDRIGQVAAQHGTRLLV